MLEHRGVTFELDTVGGDQRRVRVLRHCRHLALDLLRRPYVVAVEKTR
jgi:hypothetical protein